MSEAQSRKHAGKKEPHIAPLPAIEQKIRRDTVAPNAATPRAYGMFQPHAGDPYSNSCTSRRREVRMFRHQRESSATATPQIAGIRQ